MILIYRWEKLTHKAVTQVRWARVEEKAISVLSSVLMLFSLSERSRLFTLSRKSTRERANAHGWDESSAMSLIKSWGTHLDESLGKCKDRASSARWNKTCYPFIQFSIRATKTNRKGVVIRVFIFILDDYWKIIHFLIASILVLFWKLNEWHTDCRKPRETSLVNKVLNVFVRFYCSCKIVNFLKHGFDKHTISQV